METDVFIENYYNDFMILHAKKCGAWRVVLIGFAFVFLAGLLTSCATSVLKRVEEQESPMLKLVIARDMIHQTRYGLALRILEGIKEQYASDLQITIEVDYEIAFIALSRKRYEEVQERLEAIVAKYDTAENKNALPQWPYYLSKKLLETSVYPVMKKRKKKTQKANEKNSDETAEKNSDEKPSP